MDTCTACGKAAPTQQHHVVARALGGTDRSGNLVELCEECHGKVHGLTFLHHSLLVKEGLRRARNSGKRLGAPRGNKNRKGKLKEYPAAMVDAVKHLRAQKLSLRVIADRLGVSHVTVLNILRRAG